MAVPAQGNKTRASIATQVIVGMDRTFSPLRVQILVFSQPMEAWNTPVAQNETIIQNHIELLLAINSLLEELSKGTKAVGACKVAALPSAR